MAVHSKHTNDQNEGKILFEDLPIGSLFRLEIDSSECTTWYTKVTKCKVRRNLSGNEVILSARVDPKALIAQYRLPKYDEVKRELRSDRKQLRKEKTGELAFLYRTRNPEAQMRLEHALELSSVALGVSAGPRKNPLDCKGNYKRTEWEDVPPFSYFTLDKDPEPKSNVYMMGYDNNNDSDVILCSSYNDWVAGNAFTKNDERKVADIITNRNAKVTVLNAPTLADLQEIGEDTNFNVMKWNRIIEQFWSNS